MSKSELKTMQIIKLEYHDRQRNIRLSDVNFSRLNVLKGNCGSGKSTVIDGIYTLTRIAQGAISPDDSWKLIFVDLLGRTVVWRGQFGPDCSKPLQRFSTVNNLSARLVSESISIDGLLVFERFDDYGYLSGCKVSLEGLQHSALCQFAHQSDLKIVAHSLASIAVYNHDSMVLDNPQMYLAVDEYSNLAVAEYFRRKPKSSISELHHNFIELDCREKIYYAYEYDKAAFAAFERLYCMVYPQVAQVLPRMITTSSSAFDTPVYFEQSATNRRGVLLSVRLTDGRYVEQGSVSSGMFKTMMVLANSMFSSPHALMVYDGLESGLDSECLSYIVWSIQALTNQHSIASHGAEIDIHLNREEQKWVVRQGNVISFASHCVGGVKKRFEGVAFN